MVFYFQSVFIGCRTIIMYLLEIFVIFTWNSDSNNNNNNLIPKSVNYHFTRICNYSCGFCFHTAKTSFMLPLDEVKHGFDLLKKAGMEKINFSGGEPFIPKRGKFLGEMVQYCKEFLKVSVSIISNGSLITEKWLQKYGKYVDILAVSCDSFNEETNKKIGRRQGSRDHVKKLWQIRDWCKKYDILFKINTVVNTYNQNETMIDEIKQLNPIRWKVFQCLLIEGENVGEEALRNAAGFYIAEETFKAFIKRHESISCIVPESNDKMQNSYLILDEYMRFLDCQGGSKEPSKSILDVGVENALRFSGFDEAMFKKRGGFYKWSKEANKMSCVWKAEGTKRSRVISHSKCVCRISPCWKKMSYYFLTSANLSRSAWGIKPSSDSSIFVRSYEMGVLFLPKYFGEEYFATMEDPDRKNQRLFPIMFDLPLTRYGPDDESYCGEELIERLGLNDNDDEKNKIEARDQANNTDIENKEQSTRNLVEDEKFVNSQEKNTDKESQAASAPVLSDKKDMKYRGKPANNSFFPSFKKN